jgi:hypothetical protein
LNRTALTARVSTTWRRISVLMKFWPRRNRTFNPQIKSCIIRPSASVQRCRSLQNTEDFIPAASSRSGRVRLFGCEQGCHVLACLLIVFREIFVQLDEFNA